MSSLGKQGRECGVEMSQRKARQICAVGGTLTTGRNSRPPVGRSRKSPCCSEWSTSNDSIVGGGREAGARGACGGDVLSNIASAARCRVENVDAVRKGLREFIQRMRGKRRCEAGYICQARGPGPVLAAKMHTRDRVWHLLAWVPEHDIST